MSTPWRITRGNDQFQAKDVAELKLLAIGGKIKAGDLIQPPGRSDWLYATEVPELDGLIKAGFNRLCWVHPDERPAGLNVSDETRCGNGGFLFEMSDGRLAVSWAGLDRQHR